MTDPINTEEQPQPRLAQIVGGSLLALVGVAWLLDVADVMEVPWGALLPAALMVIGAALVAGARTGPHSGLVALGVVLSILVVLGSVAEVLLDVPLSGGIGEQTYDVASADLEDEYRWAIGKMVVDLSDVAALADDRSVEISLAIGELIVIVPRDFDVEIHARAGIGEAIVLGQRASGIGNELEVDAPGAPLTLDVDVALGKVEVRR